MPYPQTVSYFSGFKYVPTSDLIKIDDSYRLLGDIQKIEVVHYLSSRLLYAKNESNYSEKAWEFIRLLSNIHTRDFKAVINFVIQ